jgi:hypothetical protein
MSDDEKFIAKFAPQDEEPPAELYSRIITVVPQLPQWAPRAAERGRLLKFFSEWGYALEVKCASLALAALIGFFAGQTEWRMLGQETFYSAIVTGDISWEN